MKKLFNTFLKDNLQWAITIYLFTLFVIYPLYFRDGYYDIDYAKYEFLKISTGIGLITILICFLIQIFMKRLPRQASVFSITDICVLAYMLANCVSLAFSTNTKLSLWGQRGWYMGALTAIAFAYMYFAVTKLWNCNRYLVPMTLVGSFVVFLLGALNRFGIWPIPIEIEYQFGYISTIGNIGWYSSYLAVIAPLGVTLLIDREKYKMYQQVLLALYTFVVFVTGFSQGADSIFIFFAVLLLGNLFVASYYDHGLKHWLEIVIIWCLAGQLVHTIRYIWPESYRYEPDNLCGRWGNSFYTLWILIPVVLVYIAVLYVEAGKSSCDETDINKCSSKVMRIIPVVILSAGIIGFAIAIIYSYILGMDAYNLSKLGSMFYLDKYWGGGRGATINIGLNIWLEQGFGRRLIGIGPDCFAHYISSSEYCSAIVREVFNGATLSNAHNEFITNLVNIGAIGTVAFYGILVSYARTSVKMLKKDIKIAAVAICMLCYVGYNVINYAEVINYPFYMVLVGLGEMWQRIENEKE